MAEDAPPPIHNADEPLSFETHVSQHADAILTRLQAGTMPCDGAWPQAQVDLFRRWAESGKPS